LRKLNKIARIVLLLVLVPFMAGASIFQRDLFWGIANDEDVRTLQKFLHNQGVYSGPVTGNFFSLTRGAVKKFQERESIAPALGYFGPQTRGRANELAKPKSKEDQITFLKNQIKILQERLKKLQEQALEENQPPQIELSKDTIPPIFTRRPYLSKKEFFKSPMPLGPHYPYKIMFDWTVDESGYVKEAISCSPPLKFVKTAGKLTEYLPEPHTSYSCRISAKDLAGNAASEEINFTSPSWVSIDGFRKTSFPPVKTIPLLLGDIAIYNGTTTDILFAQMKLLITDSMNSFLNRGKEVTLILRNGTSTDVDIISKTNFTFHSTAPKEGEPHKYLVSLSFPVLFQAGEEKIVSLWIENLDYVVSGALIFTLDEFLATEKTATEGGLTLQQGAALILSGQKTKTSSLNIVGGFDLGLNK